MSFRKLTPEPSKSRKSKPRKPARKNVKKHLFGSVGVSGDRPENDEAVAVFGVEKVGLVADVG
jgi:hypothetical protein